MTQGCKVERGGARKRSNLLARHLDTGRTRGSGDVKGFHLVIQDYFSRASRRANL